MPYVDFWWLPNTKKAIETKNYLKYEITADGATSKMLKKIKIMLFKPIDLFLMTAKH